MTKLVRAVAYARVSSDEQAAMGSSLAAQEASMRAYCEWRCIELVELITDPAVSAGRPLGKRPGGGRLQELVAAKQVDAVIAMKLDRLFRSTVDCLAVTSAWERDKIAMHLVDMGGQSVDTSTTLGRFMLTLLAAMGEMERGLTGERTRAVLAHKRAKGERATGVAPFGYRFDGKRVVEDDREQGVLARIRTMRRDGTAVRSIAACLNHEGVEARGERWHATTVARLLDRMKEGAS